MCQVPVSAWSTEQVNQFGPPVCEDAFGAWVNIIAIFLMFALAIIYFTQDKRN